MAEEAVAMAEDADAMAEDAGEVADGAEAAGELVFPGLASVGSGQGQAEPDTSEETGAVNERDIADLAPSSAPGLVQLPPTPHYGEVTSPQLHDTGRLARMLTEDSEPQAVQGLVQLPPMPTGDSDNAQPAAEAGETSIGTY